MSKFGRSLVVAVAEFLLVGMPAVVSATPGMGVSSTIVAKGTSPDGIVVSSHGPTEVTVGEFPSPPAARPAGTTTTAS
jgi:hypothetical protein